MANFGQTAKGGPFAKFSKLAIFLANFEKGTAFARKMGYFQNRLISGIFVFFPSCFLHRSTFM